MSVFSCVASAARVSLVLCLFPLAAQAALPAVGQQVGASVEELKQAMDLAGCPLQAIAVEAGKVAATCQDPAGVAWKVVVDPTTGRVTEIARAR
jgi:hypothetical protein